MNWKMHTMTRQELYAAVWAEPMRRVAQRLGVSDVALSKACRRHGIPVPSRGYWAKLAAGRAPAKPELPKLEGDELPVVIRGNPDPTPEHGADPEVEDAVAANVPAEPIHVPDTLEDATPVVRRTIKSLKRAKADERGLVHTNGPGLLTLAVTKANIDRAGRITEAIVRSCQAGGMMDKTRAADADFSIRLEGQSLPFSIKETVNRTERPDTPAERRRRERNPFAWDRRPQYDYHPTGRLTFRFDGYGNGHRMSWSDGKTQRLEELLNDIIAGAVRLAVYWRRRQEEAEARQRAWAEAERLRRERERQSDEEERRCERLMARTELWKMAVQIRDYVAAVEEANARDSKIYEEGSPESGWLQWASWVADQLDPTIDEPLYHVTLNALWHVRTGDRYPAGGNPLLKFLES